MGKITMATSEHYYSDEPKGRYCLVEHGTQRWYDDEMVAEKACYQSYAGQHAYVIDTESNNVIAEGC